MGTTLLAAAVRHGRAFICNVGDSRAYLLDRSLTQITADHAVEDRFIGDILLADEPVRRRGYRVLTQAVGASACIRPDHYTLPVGTGDILLLCSDGLTDMLSDQTIQDVVACHRTDLQEAADRLIGRANRKGGVDNISVILLEIVAP
jgi:protein phosphatase